MSRDIKEIAKQVRADLKKEFPSCKFSVTIDRYSMGQSMTVVLTEAPRSPFSSLVTRPNQWGETFEFDGCTSINHYHMEKDTDGHWRGCQYDLTDESAISLIRVIEIANRENWNNSDSMTDYYDVNYAFDLHIGKWDKPFKVTGQVQTPMIVEENVPTPILEAIEETPESVVRKQRTRKVTPKLSFSQRLRVALTVLKTGKI